MTLAEQFLSHMDMPSSTLSESGAIRELFRLKRHASGDGGNTNYLMKQMQRLASSLGIDFDAFMAGKITLDNWQQFVQSPPVPA